MILTKILIFTFVFAAAAIFIPPKWKNAPPPVNQNRIQNPEFLNYVGTNYKIVADNVGLKLDNPLASNYFASRSKVFIEQVSKAIVTLTNFGSSEQSMMNSLFRSEASRFEQAASTIQRISLANTRRPTGNSIESPEFPEFSEDSEPIRFTRSNTVGRSFLLY